MFSWQARLAQALPFYYGWVIFAVSVGVSYSARPLMAGATLSVFVVPMTEQFGWSRGLFSGAVSLGGLCAVAISPPVGRLIDRYGSGATVAAASAVVGLCAIGLSAISQPWAFYSLKVPGRMAWASPLELGTSTAISNWFIRRRPLALMLLGVNQGVGTALMPLVAQFIIGGWGWRTAWSSLGIFTLFIGVLPALLLMTRRPEDMGLEADPAHLKDQRPSSSDASGINPATPHASAVPGINEVNYTVQQALRTRSFWLLAAFSAAGYMVHSGMTLHQVAHFINQGLTGPAAALIASVFAFSQVLGGVLWSTLARRMPLRLLVSLSGFMMAVGAIGIGASASQYGGVPSATALGVGGGGLHLLLRLTWADYYGRQHLGSIRGLTLPIQLAGQALGPIIAGFMFDFTGEYQLPFLVFAIAVSLAGLLVLAATPPTLTQRREEISL